jgi:hypothetical protein
MAAIDPNAGKRSAPSRSGTARFLDGLGNIVLRVLPLVAVFVAYGVAGHNTTTDIQGLKSLEQLGVGLIAGIAVYTVIAELTLRSMPRRLSDEIGALVRELEPLKKTVATLDAAVAEQLRALTDLREMEIFYEKDDALIRARRLQSSASQGVDAMWTLIPYDDALRQYFAETLRERIYTSRIVSASNVPLEHLLDHIDKSWEYLAAGTYQLHLVRECNYEALIVDHTTAGLFFYSSQGYGSCFMSSSSGRFVQVVGGLIADLKRPDGRIPIERDAPKDLDRIRTWLDSYYQGL